MKIKGTTAIVMKPRKVKRKKKSPKLICCFRIDFRYGEDEKSREEMKTKREEGNELLNKSNDNLYKKVKP